MTRRDATIDGRNATVDLIEYVVTSETFATLSRPKCSFPICQTLFIFGIIFRISLLVFQVKRTFAVCVFPLSSPTTLYHRPLSLRIFIFIFFLKESVQPDKVQEKGMQIDGASYRRAH